MSALYKPISKHVTITSGTITEVQLPQGSCGHLFLMSGSTAWEIELSDPTMVAGSIPLVADQTYSIEVPVIKSSIYVRQTSGTDKVLRWAYLVPTQR